MASNKLTIAEFETALEALATAHVAGKRSLIELAQLTLRAVREGTCPEDKLSEFARETYVRFAKANNATKGMMEPMETDATKAKSSVSKLHTFVKLGKSEFKDVDVIGMAVRAHMELVDKGVKVQPTDENVVY